MSWRLRISRSIPLNRWVPNMNIPSHNIPRPSSFILPPDNGSLSYRPLDGQWSLIRPDINRSHLRSPVSVCLVCHPLVTITIKHHIRNCLVGWSALWSIFCENFHCWEAVSLLATQTVQFLSPWILLSYILIYYYMKNVTDCQPRRHSFRIQSQTKEEYVNAIFLYWIEAEMPSKQKNMGQSIIYYLGSLLTE